MLSLAAVCDDVAATHTALIVPGQWRWFDETDVAMLLGSRRLWIADARDPRQRAVGREAMERHYDWVSRRRERQGAALRLSDSAPSIDELVAWRDGGG